MFPRKQPTGQTERVRVRQGSYYLWIAAEVNSHALISAAQLLYDVCQEEIIEIIKYCSLINDNKYG